MLRGLDQEGRRVGVGLRVSVLGYPEEDGAPVTLPPREMVLLRGNKCALGRRTQHT